MAIVKQISATGRTAAMPHFCSKARAKNFKGLARKILTNSGSCTAFCLRRRQEECRSQTE